VYKILGRRVLSLNIIPHKNATLKRQDVKCDFLEDCNNSHHSVSYSHFKIKESMKHNYWYYSIYGSIVNFETIKNLTRERGVRGKSVSWPCH